MYGVNLIVLTFHVSSVAYANSDLVPDQIEEKESLTSGNKASCPEVERANHGGPLAGDGVWWFGEHRHHLPLA